MPKNSQFCTAQKTTKQSLKICDCFNDTFEAKSTLIKTHILSKKQSDLSGLVVWKQNWGIITVNMLYGRPVLCGEKCDGKLSRLLKK